MRRAPAIALLAAVVWAVACCGTAWATAAPGWMASHPESEQQAIVDMVYDEAPQGVRPYAGAPADMADRFVTERSTAMASADEGALSTLAEQEVATGVRARLLPTLASALSRAGWALEVDPATAWIPVTALVLQGAVDKLIAYDRIAVPPQSDYRADAHLVPLAQGEPLDWLCGFGPWPCTSPAMPYDGFYLSWQNRSNEFYDDASSGTCARPAGPSGFDVVSGPHFDDACLASWDPVDVYAGGALRSYVKPEPKPVSPPRTAPSSPPPGVIYAPAPDDPGVEVARPAITTALDADGADLQRALLDWGLYDGEDLAADPLTHGPTWTASPPTEEERWCEKSAPGAGSEVLAALSDHDPFDPFDHYPSSIGDVTMRMGFSNLANYTYERNFGLRKIATIHGWTVIDAAETQSALSKAPTKTPTTDGRRIAQRFGRYTFEGDPYEPSPYATEPGTCKRVVVVDTIARPGEPAPRGIVTSYGEFAAAG
jgi:hypothetical protein